MADGMLQVNVASVVEDALQHHLGNRMLTDVDLASRKSEQASLRRYEAAGWLRKMVGVVGSKDLPAQPSEDEFRLGLRSGIVLCNVLNKVQAGSVPKIVEAASDTVAISDGAALSAYQYFENVRNFLVAIEDLGVPAFETSDLEQGGKSSRIVNSVLALKSYHDWKQGGGIGVWRSGGNRKPPSADKQFVRRNSDAFLNPLSRTSSTGDKSPDAVSSEENSCGDLVQDFSEAGPSHSLSELVHELLSDKKREDIPVIVENMLHKVMVEVEHRLMIHNAQIRASSTHTGLPNSDKCLSTHSSEELETLKIIEADTYTEKSHSDSEERHKQLVEYQQNSIQELKYTLHSAKEDMHMLQIRHQEEVNKLSVYLHGLANAASGYQQVLEENRRLYNQVQDLKGNIRVYCRVRPFLPGRANGLTTVGNLDDMSITITTPSKYGKDGSKSFSFNKVFGPSASQEEVFADTRPLIRSVLDGYNVCIFAYGQTGSGKTFTMTGPGELAEESLGVNYRALSDLFLISEQRKDTISYEVSVQMIEIYNEQVRDLLVTDGVQKKLEIRNNSQNGVNVPNANLVRVTSTSDVIELMNLGHKNRAVGATAMNNRSSRSHSCLTVHVQGKDMASGTVLRGCMHLVDLAGSERAHKSEAVGDRLKEAQHINRSLSALGDVIASLAAKQSHVPYRNSKLTQLLQDSLGGQAKTLMFIHISPELDAIGETISTLKFAERVSTVELGTARANKESSQIKELKEQIASLKAALSEKGAESGNLQHSESSNREVLRTVDSSFISRRRSLDSSDFLMDSSPRTPLSNEDVMEEEDYACGDWVDKVMVNKEAEDCKELPEMLLNYVPNDSRIYPEQISVHRRHSIDNSLARTRLEAARAVTAPDDSEELDAATSDSSEVDYRFQLSVLHSNNTPNVVVASKTRIPSPKPRRGSETRSLIPQPTARKVLNGIQSPLQRPRRQSSFDARRKPSIGK